MDAPRRGALGDPTRGEVVIRARAAAALTLVIALVATLVPSLSAAAAPVPVLAVAPAASVAAQDPSSQEVPGVGSAGVKISHVTPVVAAPGEPVRISGTLDVAELGIDPSTLPGAAEPTTDATTDHGGDPNASSPEPEPVATVEIRLAADRVADGAAVTAWAQSTSPSAGALLVSEPVFAGAQSPTPGFGTTIPFSVTVDDLSPFITASYGAVPISLQVYLPRAPAPVRVVHTFLGFEATKEYAPLGITVIVPFTLPADAALVGEFGEERATAWETLLSPDSPLSEQLTLAAAPGVVWAIDPLLLSAGPAVAATTPPELDEEGLPVEEGTSGTPDAEAGAAGSGETDPPSAEDGSPIEVPGTPDDLPADPTPGPAARERVAREAYLQRLLDAADGREIMLLPAGDADVAALPEAGTVGEGPDAAVRLLRETLDVTEAADLLEAAGAEVRPVLWPVGGVWSAGQDEVLRARSGGGDWSVLVDTGSIAAAGPADAQTGPLLTTGGSHLLAYESALSSRVTAAVRGGDPVLAGLTVMADTLMTLNERPGTPRHQLIVLERSAEPRDADDLQGPLQTLSEVPWVRLDQIPAATEPGVLEAASSVDPTTILPTLLTEERLAALGDTEARLDTAAALRINTGIDLATRGRDALGQLLSSRWRNAEDEWESTYAPLADQVASTFTSIHIPARDIAFLADNGLVRVTVENSLDDGLRNATMELSVDHPILRIESGPQPVDVGADSRSTVSFQASAISSGRVSVTAIVRTENGTVLGEPTTFTVRVSPTSDWIYWLLGGLAGLVILIGIARTVLRRHPES